MYNVLNVQCFQYSVKGFSETSLRQKREKVFAEKRESICSVVNSDSVSEDYLFYVSLDMVCNLVP